MIVIPWWDGRVDIVTVYDSSEEAVVGIAAVLSLGRQRR